MAVIRTREQLQEIEQSILAPYACKSAESRGRQYPEEQDPQRTVFQRDRDRIIHSSAFRRLRGKTQVFVEHHGDHFRNRLTHTMEVAQLARDFSRNLGLNEDLAEAISLAHDLGHTPFGHAGQQAMRELLHRYGLVFEHNLQSRRIVEKLEKKSSEYGGLNLSWEVRDGLIKHRNADYEDAEGLSDHGSLEAQVVDISDQIAYQNHDIEDGLRAGIILPEELQKLEIWREAESRVSNHPPVRRRYWQIVSALIKIMAGDLLKETYRNLQELDPKTNADIRNASKPIAAFSERINRQNDALRHFLYSKFYRQPEVIRQSEQGMQTIKRIFFSLHKHPDQLPEQYRQLIDTGEQKEIVIKDFIAGMTDGFALDFATKLK